MNRVVIVDDDAVNRQMAGHLLSKAGMRVTAFKSGQAFLDHVVDYGLPDLILLDIRMPDMDGFETLKRFQSYEKENELNEVPVIFLTADDDSENEQQGFAAGAADYIHKPFDPEILVKRIQNVLDQQETISHLRTEASLDQLTGFLNKAAVEAQFPSFCLNLGGCLMMIDLDSFKLVNDLHGHEMGDRILQEFAKIIREDVPLSAVIGRIGGDEFLAAMPGINGEESVIDLSNRINTRLGKLFLEMVGGRSDIPFGVSMGVAFSPQHGRTYKELLHHADKALYASKNRGLHGCMVYRGDMDEGGDNVEADLRTLSSILGERSIPDKAYQLDKSVFGYVYQFVIRYITRNKRSACKVLLTLTGRGISEDDLGELCDQFDEHLKQSLRKSDIYTRSRYNQFFVFLTDIKESGVQKVIDKMIGPWYEERKDRINISCENEFITMSDESKTS